MTERMKVLIADAEYAATVRDLAPNFDGFELIGATPEHSAADLASPEIGALVVQTETVDAALLAALPQLKIVLKLGRSYHNIDTDAVRARGLTLASAPRKGPNCVAELALTFIMALSKDLRMSHEAVADGAYRYRGIKPEITAQWKMAFHWMKNAVVHEVGAKTLGIIGMGEIGCELARRTSVLGMRNIYYKRTPLSAELERRFDAEYRDLPTLLSESDYVVIAAPHTPDTERMIGAHELSLMKPSAYLINIARGGVIEEDALIAALSSRQIAGAGLDVFTYEPLPKSSPLCALDNVILTPHIGGGSGTNRGIELGDGLSELARIAAGERPRIDLSQGL